MITKLRARNFKSWHDTGALEVAPLTGLFGTNSSGKTSILQLLLMLKQTAESPDRKRVLHTGDERSLVDLGTFYDLVYGHDPGAPLLLTLSWDLGEPLSIADPESKNALYDISGMTFETEILKAADRVIVKEFGYRFQNHEFGMKWRAPTGNGKARDEYDLLHGDYPAKRVQGRAWPLPSPVKCYGFPDEATGYYQNTGFLADFVLAFEDVLSSVAYLGPLREYPKRTYIWAGERPVDVGARGDKAIAALLAARAEGLKSGRGTGRGRRYKRTEERVAEWLREMGVIESFSLKPIAKNRKDYEVRVRRNSASPEVLITDVGFGVSQVLPVLVLCYYVPEGSTVILEQPEIHLHPSVQAALADVFIDVVKERGVQIIVESHSEHLLRRLQRRIAEEGISNTDTALYFCSTTAERSSIERLDVDMLGNIQNWPADFFGDELGDLAAMTTHAIRRTTPRQ